MSQELPHIVPSAQPQEVESIFEVNHTTREFYREVKARDEYKRYCQWYYAAAQEHRQDLEKMRGEFNFFRLFRRQ